MLLLSVFRVFGFGSTLYCTVLCTVLADDTKDLNSYSTMRKPGALFTEFSCARI